MPLSSGPTTCALTGAAIGALVAALFEATPLRRLEPPVADRIARSAADAEKARASRVRIVLRDPDDAGGAARLWAELITRLTPRRPGAFLIDDDAPLDDASLEAAALRSGRVVVPLRPARTEEPASPLPEKATVSVYGELDAPLASSSPRRDAAARASDRLGVDAFDVDPDGRVRRLPLVVRSGEETAPTVPLACAMTAFGESSVRVVDDGETLSRFAGIDVPLDDGALRLRYRGPAGTFETADARSLLRALETGAEDEWLESLPDRALFLFGVRTTEATLATPVDAALPRVEVVATALDNLIRADALRRVGFAARLALAAALAAAAALVARTHPRAAWLLLSVPVVAAGAWYAVGAVLEVVGPTVAVAVAVALGRGRGAALGWGRGAALGWGRGAGE